MGELEMQNWFVITAHSRRERWAAENIRNQGAEAYVPVMEVRGKRGQIKAHTEPVFPGYVFARTTGQWRFLLGTFGVRSLLMTGDLPSTLSDKEIRRLKARETDGVVMLPRLPTNKLRAMRKGVRVMVKGENALAGMYGVYDGMGPQQRCKVLLDVMGRTVPMLVASDQLEEIAS